MTSSRTTTKAIDGLLDPDGAWSAAATHSLTSSSGTGREKSSRFRTARVVVSNWSGVRSSAVTA